MKLIPIILITFLLLSVTPASANVTLIFTEPLLKGATDMRIFYASNSTLLGNIVTNGSSITLDKEQSYIIQVLPTGVTFANDPIASFEYMERGIPAIFSISMAILMAFVVVVVAVLMIFGRSKKR